MAEITEAIQQDAIAESLLGDPEGQPSAEEPVAEEQGEALETAEPVEQAEESTEEGAEDWLPSEQDKTFTDETLLRYAQRYNRDEQWLSDPLNRQLIVDKINSDIYLRQQAEQPQEEEQAEPVRQEPTPSQQMTPQQWAQHVDNVAKNYINPDMAQHFANSFLKSFGVEKPATPQMAAQLAHVFTSGVLNVVNSILPDMLNSKVGEKTFFQDLMDKNFEGFNDSYETTNYERAFAKATAETPLAGKSLREIGPQLQEAAQRIAGSVEDFDALQFKGKDGKALSSYQNAVKKYSMLAKAISGQKLTPAEAKTFLDAGKKAAQKQQLQRSAGNLGSGKSNGNIASGNSDSDFWKEGVELYQREHGRL